MNIFESELAYPFQNASLLTEGHFFQISPKIRCHGNVPWVIEKKDVQIKYIQTNTYHLVKKLRKSIKWILR